MWIRWRESLAIGVEEIDSQHRELVEQFGRLLVACEQGRGGLGHLVETNQLLYAWFVNTFNSADTALGLFLTTDRDTLM